MNFSISIKFETTWHITGHFNETQNKSENMSNIILTPIKMSTKQKISVTQYSPGRKIQGSDNASKIAVE